MSLPVTLNVQSGTRVPIVTCMQGDTPTLACTVLDGTDAFDASSFDVYTFSAESPKSKAISINGTLSGNVVTVNFTNNETDEAGDMKAVIEFSNSTNNTVKSTFPMIIKITENPSYTAVGQIDNVSSLTDYVNQAKAYADQAENVSADATKAIEASAQAVENASNASTSESNAATYASNASDSATYASEYATNAATSASTASSKASDAATSESNAATYATEAAASAEAASQGMKVATDSSIGAVKPDGTSVIMDTDGTLHSTSAISESTGESMTLSDTIESPMMISNAVRNLLNYDLATLKTLNNIGTWVDNVYTLNGVSFTVNDDMSITASGTASDNAIIFLETYSFSKGTYSIHGCPSGGSKTTYLVYSLNTTSWVGVGNDYGSGYTFKPSGYTHSIRLKVMSGVTVSNLIFKPMLEVGSVMHSYAPNSGYTIISSDSDGTNTSSVTITPDTEFPLMGLQSYDDTTNILSPTSVTVGYAGNESGKGMLTELVNADTPTYDEASEITALTSGEKLSTAFGKIKKAVSSLISHIADTTIHFTTQNNVITTEEGYALDARQGKVLQDEVDTINSDLSAKWNKKVYSASVSAGNSSPTVKVPTASSGWCLMMVSYGQNLLWLGVACRTSTGWGTVGVVIFNDDSTLKVTNNTAAGDMVFTFTKDYDKITLLY